MRQEEQPAEIFRRAVAAVLAQWTLLNLAVEQGWGGRESHRKRHQLYEDILSEFEQNTKVDAEDLADNLSERLTRDFCVDVEDNSDLEVAKLLVELHEQTKQGRFELACAVQQEQQQRAAAAAQSRCGNAPAAEEHCDGSEASGIEQELEALMGSTGIASHTPDGIAGRTRSRLAAAAAAAAAEGSVQSEAPPEEDGWTTMGSSGRTRRAR